ncbi:MAG: S-methyl-5-thioribose-1-phosphate isomerase [Chitinispirillales bacterium]|jgi:methylthioribose-1-phosphate isomerase|nr:S-methyl-5-thioribose-1-phosphate isomerase [Chitinispirillales bacterium]
MLVNGKHYRTIWLNPSDDKAVSIIDQTKLPHSFETIDLRSVEDFRRAIKDMWVRGAGLIGATAGYGMYVAALEAKDENFDDDIKKFGEILLATRPTAKNLSWAVERMIKKICRNELSAEQKRKIAKDEAESIANEDAEFCRKIGENGLEIIREISKEKNGSTVNVLTHCNAGWLAFTDYGSALSPIYAAKNAGIDIHVWVDETRPRNQGASLTAWELGRQGVTHHLIADNSGGHLMQRGLVDMVIVGADRVSLGGDAANKIGTYLKALAAKDNDVPFFAAFPSSTFDFEIFDGVLEIPIEERTSQEVRVIGGKDKNGDICEVCICPDSTPAKNWGFDVTPARLITKLITERGVFEPNKDAILRFYPEAAL